MYAVYFIYNNFNNIELKNSLNKSTEINEYKLSNNAMLQFINK